MSRTSTLTVRQAALKLRCSLKFVYDLLYAGRLRGATKVDRTWRIPARAIEERLKLRGRPLTPRQSPEHGKKQMSPDSTPHLGERAGTSFGAPRRQAVKVEKETVT